MLQIFLTYKLQNYTFTQQEKIAWKSEILFVAVCSNITQIQEILEMLNLLH